MKKIINFKFHLRYLFVPADLIATFVLSIITFLPIIGWSTFINDYLNVLLIYSVCVSVMTVLVFVIFKIYKMITIEFGLFESINIAIIVFCVQIIGLIVILCTAYFPEISKAGWAWLVGASLLSFVLPSLRLITRLVIVFLKAKRKTFNSKAIVIGAGSAGKIVLDESRRNVNNHSKVVAFVDDSPNKINRTFCGIPVLGPINKIKSIIELYNAEEVIIAISDLSNEKLHEYFELLVDTNVRVRRMPILDEMDGPNEKKIIDVNLNDLLRRDPILLNNEKVSNMLDNNVVMVTGAGGSIGSELVRQIYSAKPSTLILFDIYENSTYEIQQELRMQMRKDNCSLNLITLIGSTYDEKRLNKIFNKYKPNYVYHAAAYKHVPLMEDSPMEAIRTNVIGTYNVAKLCDKYKVKKMVLVSTDKAVRPTNTMGATKRFAETIIQYFASKSINTKYAAVRFGNVLGSNGSVVPLFKKQIENGGPITLTHSDVIRYFMTIPEAVSLILQCGLFAEGGEIFILDMGNPVKIKDLAERLVRQAGLTPYKDIDIIATGLRPGEKLYEELLLDKNTHIKTENNKIFIEPKDSQTKPIEEEIVEISKVFDMDNNKDIKRLLKSIITTYTIDERE